MSTFIVRLFGSLQVANGRLPASRYGRTLLAYLLLHPGYPHGRPQLATLLAPEWSEARGRKTLRQALWEVRRCLPPGAITTHTDTITLHPALVPHDVAQFDSATADLPRQPHLRDPAHAETIRHALALYTADLLTDQYEDWLIAPREQRREQYLLALERLAAWEKQNGRLPAALHYTQQLATADPLRETAHRELIRLYTALQRPQAALQQYTLCQQILREELGLDPEPETQQLAQALLVFPATTPNTPYLPPPTPPAPAYALHETNHLPLIGRHTERQQLLHHLGHGGLLLLAGEAGMGKSRLVQAVAEDAAWRGLDVVWGHTAEHIPQPPYHPLRQALTSLLTPLRQQQVGQLLDAVWPPHLAQILPSFGPASAPHQSDQARLHEAIAQLLVALGRIKPILLIVEDLHWSDPTTLACLADLAPQLRHTPILILATYREQAMRDEATLWQALQALDEAGVRQRIHLPPLTAEQTAELVQCGLGLTQPAPRFAHRLHQQAAGSPLLVLELLRTLHDEGHLTRDEAGQWHTPFDNHTTDYAELPIPPTNLDLVQKRLAHLPPTAVQTAQWAAVLGREIDFAWLAAVAELPAKALVPALTLLGQRQFLQETATSYRFTHDTIREAIYGTLSPAERRQIHGRLARLLQADPRATAAQRAYHSQQGELWAEAIGYAQQAAEEAEALYDNHSALAHYAALLAMLDSHPQAVADATRIQFDVLQARQRLLGRVGAVDQQEQELTRLSNLPLTDAVAQVQLLNQWAIFWNEVRNEQATSLDYTHRALAMAEAHGLTAEIARALLTQASIARHAGQPEQALPLYERAWQLANSLPHNETQTSTALRGYIRAHVELGQWLAAEPLLAHLVATAEQSGDVLMQGMAYGERGVFYYDIGHYAQVVQDYEIALQHYRTAGAVHSEAVTLSNLGLAHWSLLHYQPATAAMLAGLALYERLGNRRGMLYAHNNLADLYIIAGQWAAAEASLNHGLALAQELNQPEMLVLLNKMRVSFCLASGDVAGAETAVAQTEASGALLQAPYSLACVAYARGQWLAHHHQWAAAHHALQEAIAKCRKSQRVWALPAMVSLGGWVLAQMGQPEAGIAQSAEAVALHETHACDEGLLVYWRHYQLTGDVTHLNQAHTLLQTVLAALPPDWQAPFLACFPNGSVAAAWQAHQPRTAEVWLPRTNAPTRGKLTADQLVAVRWTVQQPADGATADPTARRQQQVAQLTAEAVAQGARPTTAALAEALGVSVATIKRLRGR